jgi:hypothetical protein
MASSPANFKLLAICIVGDQRKICRQKIAAAVTWDRSWKFREFCGMMGVLGGQILVSVPFEFFGSIWECLNNDDKIFVLGSDVGLFGGSSRAAV